MAGATGKRIRRVEDPRFLTGRGNYVEDIKAHETLHLAFVRSPFAAARITRLNVDAAKGAAGVVLVATGDDTAELSDVPVIPLPFAKVAPHPPLARGRVACVGYPIAAVIAESAEAARDAADLVEVDYEPEAAVSSAEAALAPDAPRVHPQMDSNLCYVLKKAGGDVDKAFAEAEVTASVRVDSPRVAPISVLRPHFLSMSSLSSVASL